LLILGQFTGFDWDGGNRGKNRRLHSVSDTECEQIFFNQPLLTLPDEEHADGEARCLALGRTDGGRRLAAIFTTRQDKLRVISARDMTSAKGRYIHDEQEKDSAVCI
jgi:uncharacterized DUF497 family protein